MKVGVVTGYTPLPVKHLSEAQYTELGDRLHAACLGAASRIWWVGQPLKDFWACELCRGLPPANPPPADRYETPEINVMSHIVQHQRTTWALAASEVRPDVDCWVWFDYGLLKQGLWKNNPITEDTVRVFLRRLSEMSSLDVIPFPGITPRQTVYPTGNVWRFCGSTHIWPKQWLAQIDANYKAALMLWLEQHKTVPLDLPIWAIVEQRSRLPFRWYQAEYDATQLDNFGEADLSVPVVG